jgi:hypothetical protein
VIFYLVAIIGAAIGITFADVDQVHALRLRHRSGWTHGPLVVWLLSFLLTKYPVDLFYWFAVGFLPAHAIHLFADMFPRNWKGGALIYFNPLKTQLRPIFSFAFLALGVFVSGRLWLTLTGNAWGRWPW